MGVCVFDVCVGVCLLLFLHAFYTGYKTLALRESRRPLRPWGKSSVVVEWLGGTPSAHSSVLGGICQATEI